jgi:TonB-dependent receptor
VNPSLNQGNAGNPALQPVRARNLDASLEWQLSSTGSLRISPFWKHVDGFALSVSAPETIDGVVYQVTRPQNANAATIRGTELAYEQFFDFLPGALGGLGFQGNYTFINSETLVTGLGPGVPLPNLSRHSANAILLYEAGRLSARIAYNWRDQFLSGVTNLVGVGTLPIYTAPYGWLDASVDFRVDQHWSVALEGLNLLDTLRRTYYGVRTRPQSDYLNDRQLAATLRVRF